MTNPKQYMPAVASLLTPVAAAAYGMAAWRLASDLRWTGEFAISEGILSRWQVWLALAIAAQAGARQLRGTSSADGAAAS